MSIYDSAYQLISTYIYGGAATSDETLVCTIMATMACIALFALPFKIVLGIIDKVVG